MARYWSRFGGVSVVCLATIGTGTTLLHRAFEPSAAMALQQKAVVAHKKNRANDFRQFRRGRKFLVCVSAPDNLSFNNVTAATAVFRPTAGSTSPGFTFTCTDIVTRRRRVVLRFDVQAVPGPFPLKLDELGTGDLIITVTDDTLGDVDNTDEPIPVEEVPIALDPCT
jgi:hypothetical protein